ncbi:MAG: nitroreductase family protein [Armatimonadota bacterium]
MSGSCCGELMEALRGRRSIREFDKEPVPGELVEQLIDAAAWAPSAGNRQDWRFVVVQSAEVKSAMALAARQSWDRIIAENRHLGLAQELADYAAGFADFGQAPLVIAVASARPNSVQRALLGELAKSTTGSFASAAMAAQNLMLAAHALGLGSCCMTGALAASKELSEILGLGARLELVCLIAVGRPRRRPQVPQRKPRSEIARYL